MQIILNGESHEVKSPLTIAGLLSALDVPPTKVAVECNLAIVPKSQYGAQDVAEGDRIEIVHFIGGG
ncbi:MAG: sulfur carrier protein ThiS [Alphaproteobacteria bacterium]|nr:sulfur carrier protein ThiS [Alphaproteobacteria bacterium]